MITQPGVKVINYPANNAIQLTWDNMLKGKRSELRTCLMRLGIAKDKAEIKWVRRLDCRGNYKNGHVEEYLEDEDIPKTGEGEHVYCQILFEPEYVIDEETHNFIQNAEREIGISETVMLITLKNASKHKALLKNKAHPAGVSVARV